MEKVVVQSHKIHLDLVSFESKKEDFLASIVAFFAVVVLCIFCYIFETMNPAMNPAMGPAMPPMPMPMSMPTCPINMNTGMMSGCMNNMKPYFHTGNCECLLFKSWKISDFGDYFLFAAILFVICMARDGVAIGAEILLQKSKKSDLLKGIGVIPSLLDTFFYGILVTMEYAIMLIIMNYNVGLFFVIIAGLMVSRFIFYPMTIKGGQMPTTCH